VEVRRRRGRLLVPRRRRPLGRRRGCEDEGEHEHGSSECGGSDRHCSPRGATCPRRRRRVGSSAVSGRGSPPPLGASLSRSQRGGRSAPGPHSERSSPAGISKKMARRALTASSSADRDALPTGRAARVVSRGPSGAVVARARRRASVPTAFQETLRPGLPDSSTRDGVGDLQRSRVTRSSTRAANGMCDVHHENQSSRVRSGPPPHRQEAPAKVI
jgi:hypothetical protein